MSRADILASPALRARVIIQNIFPAHIRHFSGAVLGVRLIFEVNRPHPFFARKGFQESIRTRGDDVKMFGAGDIDGKSQNYQHVNPFKKRKESKISIKRESKP